ncbi:hypothetical protein Pan54_17450 [Rubinisphaera italica]|uniref:Uncharacterized protein n=1 Tax=Rubinisphaera italica TaxID=2527969 RepID=A0A5C5XGL7_9PLAN|nr:hypothetical protein Pan54_17450 [Rubinisphaera italica]
MINSGLKNWSYLPFIDHGRHGKDATDYEFHAGPSLRLRVEIETALPKKFRLTLFVSWGGRLG